MQFKKFEITQEVWELAQHRIKKFSWVNSNTKQYFNNNEIKKTGAIAEAIIEVNYPDLLPGNGIDFDFKHKIYSHTYDVKGASYIKDPIIFDAHVVGEKDHFKSDFFVFLAIIRATRTAWGIGWIKKEDYFNNATLLKKGSKHPKFKVDYDRYTLPHTKLNPFKT